MANDDLRRASMEQVRHRTQSDLEDVHSRVLPASVEVRSMDIPVQSNQGFPPSLPKAAQQEQQTEEDDDEITALEQKVSFTTEYDPNAVAENPDMTYRVNVSTTR